MLYQRTLFAFALTALLGCSSGFAGTSPDAASPGGDDGAGGTTPEGGTGSSEGGPDSGGPGTCLTGAVNFELQLAPGAGGTTYCLGPSGSCSGNSWLSILTADGGDALSQDMGCVADCTDCQPVACDNLCAIASPLGDAGAHMTWNGTYLQQTTCGTASLACTNSECAPAGNYIARMCGYSPSADAGSQLPACVTASTPTCIDVPFVWPPPSGTSTVQAELGSDGGV
jgi:hypothetical protein